jgi:hypothetical protein
MNCKPGQMAMVMRASVCKPCSAKVQGLPTKVSHVITPISVMAVLQEQIEGPVWLLAEPFRCPFNVDGCTGVDRMPDQCLRPFDPESEPEPAAEDTPVGVPVEAA